MIVGLADRGVARGFVDVGGLVDHHRRVAGADAVGRLAGAVRGFDHRRAAGGDRQIADRHQFVGQRNARLLDALQHVFRHAQLLQRRAHQANGFVRRLPARGMRREDHRVLALDRVDRDADRRDVRTGDGNQRADHAGGLRVLDDALLGDLLDDRPCSSGEARRGGCRAPWRGACGSRLPMPLSSTLMLASFAAVSGLAPAQPTRLANAIDLRLVVFGDGGHRRPGVGQQPLGELRFLGRNRTCGHGWLWNEGVAIMQSQEARRDSVTVPLP